MHAVVAYYYLGEIQDPVAEAASHKEFLSGQGAVGRIYVSEAGINAQLSASPEGAEAYLAWMKRSPQFADLSFKIHLHPEPAFPKLTVKYRKQLVALDHPVDLSQRGTPVSPEEWDRMLAERGSDTLLLDVRNHYEWEVGRFKGAERPPMETFREFPAYADQLATGNDPKRTKVMMYCTGGIRCEFYSALLKEKGFEQVFQLEGGVIQYGLERGQNNWEGKLFVFDDRLVVPISEESAPPVSACSQCGAASDTYYNCANMDCNALFLSCPACLHHRQGCCSTGCLDGGRVRPYRKDGSSKPFRKQGAAASCGCAETASNT
jgi:UPF0176 protein